MMISSVLPALLAALALPQTWPGALPDVTAYPRPVPVGTVARAAEIPRLALDPARVERREAVANEAVRIRVLAASVQPELFGERAPEGRSFLVLTTRWENVHPKQRVDRASLEGKVDRTGGVGALSGGAGRRPEYVAVDVAYQVPRLLDHVYAVVDGAAVSLSPATGTLPGGSDPDGGLDLPRQGSTKTLALAFLVDGEPRSLALRFFDYNYGNVLVPVWGDAAVAEGAAAEPASVLDRVRTDVLEVAATGLSFRDRYDGSEAGQGRRWAVVTLLGQSLSGSEAMADIVQLDPTEYAFVIRDGGYLRYAAAGSVDDAGMIRFTPEIAQRQELAFPVPDDAERLTLGLRLRNEVITLRLTPDAPDPMPTRGEATHRDGDVLEVTLFGSRREGDAWIADLGVRPLVETQGLEVQPRSQFLLVGEVGEIPPDMSATGAGRGGPPTPFVIPPGTPVRFELVFPAAGAAEGLRFRGFRSEAILKF